MKTLHSLAELAALLLAWALGLRSMDKDMRDVNAEELE